MPWYYENPYYNRYTNNQAKGFGKGSKGMWQKGGGGKGKGQGGQNANQGLLGRIRVAQEKAAREIEANIRKAAVEEALMRKEAKKGSKGEANGNGKGSGGGNKTWSGTIKPGTPAATNKQEANASSSPDAGNKTVGEKWFCWECNGENAGHGAACKRKMKGILCGYPNPGAVAPDLRPQKVKEWEAYKAKQFEKSNMVLGEDLHKRIVLCNSFCDLEEKGVEEEDEDMEEEPPPALTTADLKVFQDKLEKVEQVISQLDGLSVAIPDKLLKEKLDLRHSSGGRRRRQTRSPWTRGGRRSRLHKRPSTR